MKRQWDVTLRSIDGLTKKIQVTTISRKITTDTMISVNNTVTRLYDLHIVDHRNKIASYSEVYRKNK